MTILEGQILKEQAYVSWYNARILSGVYKSRMVSCEGKYLTEQELLQDEINTMHRHVEIMGQCIDSLPAK